MDVQEAISNFHVEFYNNYKSFDRHKVLKKSNTIINESCNEDENNNNVNIANKIVIVMISYNLTRVVRSKKSLIIQ